MSAMSQDSIDTTAMRLQSMLARAIHEVRMSGELLADVFQDANYCTVFAVKSDNAENGYLAYLLRVRNGKLYTFGLRLHFADAYEDVRNSLLHAQHCFDREMSDIPL